MVLVVFPITLLAEDTSTSINDLQLKNVHTVIDRAYIDILQRYPDEGGLYTYSKFILQEGKSEEWLRNVLLKSKEGRQISERKQKQMHVLYGVAAFFCAFLGLVFFFSRNIKDFIFKSLLIFFSLAISCIFLEVFLRLSSAYKDYKNEQSWQQLDLAHVPKKMPPHNFVTLYD